MLWLSDDIWIKAPFVLFSLEITKNTGMSGA